MQSVKHKKDPVSLPKSDRRQADPPPQAFHSFDAGFLFRLAAICALAFCAYAAIAYAWPKFSRAEVFFAECAKEMLASENLVTPLFHGVGFFDKPILIYWLIMGSFSTFGTTHLAARLPSLVCAVLTVALTGLAGTRVFGARAGLLSAAIASSSFMFISFAGICMADMPLVLFDSLALTLMYTATISPSRRRICFWLAALSMGLGFIIKGPVAIVLPALCFAIYLTIAKKWQTVRFEHVAVSGLIMALAASPWFLAAWKANGSGALAYFFIRENLQRFAGSTYDTHRPIYFMLVSLLGGFAPWSMFLPLALWQSARQWSGRAQARLIEPRTSERVRLLCWLWIALVTAFFSVSRGKIDYYVLPVYPAAALIVGSYLSAECDRKSSFAGITGGLIALLLLLAGGASLVVVPLLCGQATPQSWAMAPVALIGLGLTAVIAVWRREMDKPFSLLAVAILLCSIACACQIVPAIVRLQPFLAYTGYVRGTSPQTRIVVDEPIKNWVDQITFDTGREPITARSQAMCRHFLNSGEPVLLFITRERFATLPALSDNRRARVIASRPFISHALTPGYLFKQRGLIPDTDLLLVTTDLRQNHETSRPAQDQELPPPPTAQQGRLD